ncbi:hypothetical protein HG535_0A02200 [Zygotorulaspora mrakii]|uniref:Mediator of RNA polymerase II transcription subunit 1 n=1 Tax=Zygotorulaspora mrakii TaxID=42260 RepID=A0A7H9AXG9_ZYGMR|nr:uncharacterized protein HG535_0A02200 [Zygotorulaspora mrakii]QLG70282.1 hypothetical protein HG535_0A02200 [Zygotorulaspora mrakii]
MKLSVVRGNNDHTSGQTSIAMEADTYNEQLGDMIELFQEYKSGSVTLENITKLCQTLGLESFIDDIDAQTARLSTASKIIVIDIDFSKHQKKVTDVKLVLASNFDNFDYFIDDQHSSSPSNNILLNSLTQYPDLHEFHSNLKFLHLLDNFSNVDIDPTNTSSSNNFGSNNSSNENGGCSGKLDLFKYYTELASFIQQDFSHNGAPFTVATNLGNSFGIYILNENQKVLARIYLEKSRDPKHRLYEFVFAEEKMDWINLSSENYTCGVSLVAEILSQEDLFPQNFILYDSMVVNYKMVSDAHSGIQETGKLNDWISENKYNIKINDKLQIMNDFTTKLIKVKVFDISNDNIDILRDILNWIQWSETVLKQLHSLLFPSVSMSDDEKNDILGGNLPGMSTSTRGRRRSSVDQKRRKHPNKIRRPSATESVMLKDEGLQQFNLHEIMTDSSSDLKSIAGTSKRDASSTDQDVKMDLDPNNLSVEESTHLLQLVISEDSISLNKIANCSLYEDPKNWKTFMDILKIHI